MQTVQPPLDLALLNPWVRSEAGLARAQVKHYYRQRLLEPAFWRKLAAGGVGWTALRSLLKNLRAMRQAAAPSLTFQELMAQGWHAFEGKILLILSERDLTAQEFMDHAATQPAWRDALQRPGASLHRLAGADHTCSPPASQAQVEDLTLAWLAAMD